MSKEKNKWISIALINLSIVAMLGVILRSKILFSIPAIDFKYILHAHSHFAFGGWITLCMLTLMTYELLPEEDSHKLIYRVLLLGILIAAAGMLLSFPFQGYAFFSILFSTLFIFVTYAYSWVFIKDLIKQNRPKVIKLLSITSLLFLCLSSVGPFTLAYMLASHSVNTLLYKDAIYTYLHLQYNGFFTQCVFSLFLNHIYNNCKVSAQKKIGQFALYLSISVVPTLCLSYLWHFQNIVIQTIAFIGCMFLIIVLVKFFIMMHFAKDSFKNINPFARKIGLLSMIAFALKTIIQTGIVYPAVGNEVFGDRPIIIGYLHLVMLGFVTLYLLAHLIQIKYFDLDKQNAKIGIFIFAIAVIANELILMTQGLAVMYMLSSVAYPWLLWVIAIFLFLGSLFISRSAMKYFIPSSSINNIHFKQSNNIS